MVIEWLEFKVPETSREKFIQKDEKIWTALLASYPGFLGKEIWLDPVTPERIILVNRWQTKEDWKSVPQTVLDETEREFAREMGQDKYEMIPAVEYQVRKFPRVKE
jgi:uncharacterized protein (TIGR03792 family)